MNSKPVTPRYLAWKRAGSPGVFCLTCDCPADADHVHAQPENPDAYNPIVTEGGSGPTPPGEYRKVGEHYVYGMTPNEVDHHNRRHVKTGSAHLPPQEEIDKAYVTALAEGTLRPCTHCADWLLTHKGTVIHVPRKAQ